MDYDNVNNEKMIMQTVKNGLFDTFGAIFKTRAAEKGKS